MCDNLLYKIIYSEKNVEVKDMSRIFCPYIFFKKPKILVPKSILNFYLSL